jgi:hypothetical protein
MAAYSFLDVNAAISGPGGAINLASGAGAAEEGISIEAVEDKNVMTIGADGSGMHSLIGSNACTVTVTLLKTSPVNAVLQQMYNYQASSSATWGRNSIGVTDLARGDLVTIEGVAFKKQSPLGYTKQGEKNVWAFDGITQTTVLGVGTPEV